MRQLTKIITVFFVTIMLSIGTLVSAIAENTLNREQVNSMIREFLLENPEILIEMQQVLENRRQEELAENQRKTLAERKDEIIGSPFQIEFGNPDAKTTIVEFFDYNCGFCQRAISDMQQILNDNDDVRFVLRDYPVLGEGSFEASRVGLAISKIAPEKLQKFHLDLLSLEGVKNGERALELAESMGIDREKILAEMENPEIFEEIRHVYELADGLGITGTPSYIAGDQVIFGAVGHEQLQAAISQ